MFVIDLDTEKKKNQVLHAKMKCRRYFFRHAKTHGQTIERKKNVSHMLLVLFSIKVLILDFSINHVDLYFHEFLLLLFHLYELVEHWWLLFD
jgi:uncharacterized membrane protein YjgN (DUF898 family)